LFYSLHVERALRLGLLSIIFFGFWPILIRAERPKKTSKPTELVVWKYETLIMEGALLSRSGWEKAVPLFDNPVPYPVNSPIRIMWTPRYIGEDWVRGNRAEVESKWIDYYGLVDAKLQYHPPKPCVLALGYELARTDTFSDWKLTWSNERAGTIEQVIAYLKQRLEATHDSAIRRNANSSIESLEGLLKKLKRGRGASAC
jgi:hypothetical protein